jgi:hypothetical protein
LTLETSLYYVGFIAATILSYGLGRMFFIPMLLNMGFNISMDAGLFTGWDVRWLMIGYGGAIFVWVVVLSGIKNRANYVGLLAMDVFIIMNAMWPLVQETGTGAHFWNVTSTSVINIWMASIAFLVGSTIVQSTIMKRLNHKSMDLLRTPRKRFLIPIGMWSATIVVLFYLRPLIPEWLFHNRFAIASHVLVWGWVAFELPQYIMHERMRRKYR